MTFRVLVASDGSPAARAALAMAIRFPWPEPSRARAVVAVRPDGLIFARAGVWALMERNMLALVDPARRVLARRWENADAIARRQAPVDAILEEARRFHAGAIVLGWRGHGAFSRLLAGSVSRCVAARSPCPVMVVRAAPPAVIRIVTGFDGSPAARRAVDLLARLEPPRRGTVTLVNVVDPLLLPSASRLPAPARAAWRREVLAAHGRRLEDARKQTEAAAARLRHSGWRVRAEVRVGAPLATLLRASERCDADVLVTGARAKRGLARLLGSVAEGAMDRSVVPVLIVP